MTFAPESWPFVAPFWIVAALLFAMGRPGWAASLFALGLLVLLFFRNPTRRFSGGDEVLISPAYGKVLKIEDLTDPEIGPGPYKRIVTFLSVFDVHVQNVPASGKVVVSRYTEGMKVAAFREDAGEKNQKHLTVIELPSGERIGVVQLAGLLARRVKCHLKEGDVVKRGQLLGVIKFGSRVDLWVPASFDVRVEPGMRVVNGETPMAVPPALQGAAR